MAWMVPCPPLSTTVSTLICSIALLDVLPHTLPLNRIPSPRSSQWNLITFFFPGPFPCVCVVSWSVCVVWAVCVGVCVSGGVGYCVTDYFCLEPVVCFLSAVCMSCMPVWNKFNICLLLKRGPLCLLIDMDYNTEEGPG